MCSYGILQVENIHRFFSRLLVLVAKRILLLTDLALLSLLSSYGTIKSGRNKIKHLLVAIITRNEITIFTDERSLKSLPDPTCGTDELRGRQLHKLNDTGG